MLRLWLAVGAAAAFAPPTRPPPRQSALHAETQAPWKALRPRPGDVVLIDGDNCRGKSKWRLSAAALDACCSSAHARGLLLAQRLEQLHAARARGTDAARRRCREVVASEHIRDRSPAPLARQRRAEMRHKVSVCGARLE